MSSSKAQSPQSFSSSVRPLPTTGGCRPLLPPPVAHFASPVLALQAWRAAGRRRSCNG